MNMRYYAAFIAGMIRANIIAVIKGIQIPMLEEEVERILPEYFDIVPFARESYIRTDATQLLTSLYNAAGCGSVRHLWAFINLCPYLVESIAIADEDEFNHYLRRSFDCYDLEELKKTMQRDHIDDYEDFFKYLEIFYLFPEK